MSDALLIGGPKDRHVINIPEDHRMTPDATMRAVATYRLVEWHGRWFGFYEELPVRTFCRRLLTPLDDPSLLNYEIADAVHEALRLGAVPETVRIFHNGQDLRVEGLAPA